MIIGHSQILLQKVDNWLVYNAPSVAECGPGASGPRARFLRQI
jgi:hypothetical protein